MGSLTSAYLRDYLLFLLALFIFGLKVALRPKNWGARTSELPYERVRLIIACLGVLTSSGV